MNTADPTDLQAQDKARREIATRNQLFNETERADFKWLMSSKRGRRIVWGLLERAGVFKLSFNTNAMAMSFAEGCKNEGTRTVGLIHTLCPELYATMVKESQDGRSNPDN